MIYSSLIFGAWLACSADSNKEEGNTDTALPSEPSDSNQPSSEPDMPPDTGDELAPPRLSMIDVSATSGADAAAFIDVEVPEGVTSMQLDLSASRYLQLQYILNPEGLIVFDYLDWTMTDERLLMAATPYFLDVSIPWPPRMSDPSIEPGMWTYVVSTIASGGTPEPYKDVSGRLTMKRDDDLTTGRVRVLAGRAIGVSDNPAYNAAISGLLTHLKDTYAEWGIEIDVREEELPINAELPNILPTSSTLISAMTYREDNEIFLVFGNTNGVDGKSAHVRYTPCPLMPSYLSIITLSWETASGEDGQLNTEELELWKSELVQAVGHYMGLNHVIDISGSSLDALSDTPACETLEECETLAGDNVMFPYPVCTSDGCLVRDQLTPQQREQLQLYTGTE